MRQPNQQLLANGRPGNARCCLRPEAYAQRAGRIAGLCRVLLHDKHNARYSPDAPIVGNGMYCVSKGSGPEITRSFRMSEVPHLFGLGALHRPLRLLLSGEHDRMLSSRYFENAVSRRTS